MKHGQAYEPRIGILCYGEIPFGVTEAIAIIGMEVHRNVMHIHTDVFRSQGSKNLRSIRRKFFEVEANGVKMPCRLDVGPHNRRNDAANLAEAAGVAFRDCPPAGEIGLKSL